MKACSKCGRAQPFSEFSASPIIPGELNRMCRTCLARHRERRYRDHDEFLRKRRETYARSGDGRRGWRLRRRYGISEDEYEVLLLTQGGSCAVCAATHVTLAVDHDHETGAVRGLLCQNCNRGVGLLGDSLPNLEAAVSYLRTG